MTAGDVSGILLTKTLVVQGNRLIVNANALGGQLLVEILDEAGEVIPGFSRNDCEAITSDDLEHAVRFGNRKNALMELSGKTIQLRFSMENTELYSFHVNVAD